MIVVRCTKPIAMRGFVRKNRKTGYVFKVRREPVSRRPVRFNGSSRMSTRMSFFQVALAVIVTLLAFASGNAQTRSDSEPNQALSDKIEVRSLDGPYSYKGPGDLVAAVGYVIEDKGSDDVVFRDCAGFTKTVKRTELTRTRIQRNCRSAPDGPWGVWVLEAGGKIAYLGLEQKQIDVQALPAEFREQVEVAQPGDWVALSYPSKDKLNLLILPKQGAAGTVK